MNNKLFSKVKISAPLDTFHTSAQQPQFGVNESRRKFLKRATQVATKVAVVGGAAAVTAVGFWALESFITKGQEDWEAQKIKHIETQLKAAKNPAYQIFKDTSNKINAQKIQLLTSSSAYIGFSFLSTNDTLGSIQPVVTTDKDYPAASQESSQKYQQAIIYAAAAVDELVNTCFEGQKFSAGQTVYLEYGSTEYFVAPLLKKVG